MMKNILSKLTPDVLSAYNRPVRSVIWVLIILIHFLSCGKMQIQEDLLFLMFADLGVNSVARTIEKIKTKNTTDVPDVNINQNITNVDVNSDNNLNNK